MATAPNNPNQAQALLRLLLGGGNRASRSQAQSQSQTQAPATPGSFSYQGKNYKIGDEFNGAKVLPAVKDPNQVDGNFRLVDSNWKSIDRPMQAQGIQVGDAVSGGPMEFNPLNEEHVRIKAQQDAEYAKASADWESKFNSKDRKFIQSSREGKITTDTYYVEREGALIPVGVNKRYEPSGWVQFRDQALKPAAMIALSSFGAPALGAALGGGTVGTVGAGAILSGASTALSGGSTNQIFRNALIGGATAGLTGAGNSAIKSALGGTEAAGTVARGITSGATAAIRGGDPLQAALMGGLGNANPQAAQLLRTVMQVQRLASAPQVTQRAPRPGR